MAYLNIIKDPLQALPLPTRGNRPVCYRLITKREYLDGMHWKCGDSSALDNAKIRRWRFGERKGHIANKTILLVGETGTGKTALINTMVNYMLGAKFGVWFDITEENDEEQSVSQTSAVTVYEVHAEAKPISLTMIDTPGYGDTRGLDNDKNISNSLCDLLKSFEGIHTIHAVGFVIKASQNRLTRFQRYIFESVLSLFGKNIEDNIVILITYSDGLPPTCALDAVKNAKTRYAKDKNDGGPIHFLFNNRQSEQHKEKDDEKYKRIWDLGAKSTEDFLEFLKKVEGQNLKMTKVVLRRREQLETRLHELIRTINFESEDEKKLEHIDKVVKENKAKLDNNESFTSKTLEMKMKKVPIKDHFALCDEEATCCDVCEKNCHFPGCTFADNLYWCTVMSGGKCKVCECSYTKHTKEDKLYMQVMEEVKTKDEDLKREIQDNYEKHVDMQETLEKKLTENRQRMSQLLDEAYKGIIELDEIALHQESLNIHVDFDILITKLNETSQTEKALKLKDIKDRAPADKYSSQENLRGNFENSITISEASNAMETTHRSMDGSLIAFQTNRHTVDEGTPPQAKPLKNQTAGPPS